MNALANEKVGDYLNDHFVSAAQKVGTFRIVNGQKQGGNVASYFCTPDGEVIHAIPGPVKADAFLREARWAVEAHKLAQLESDGEPANYRHFIGKAHADRLRTDFGGCGSGLEMPCVSPTFPSMEQVMDIAISRHRGNQARVSVLLAAHPLPDLKRLYPLVWEKILNEKVSLAPVKVASR